LERRDLRRSDQKSGFPYTPKLLNDRRRLLNEVEERKKGYATIHLDGAKRKETKKDTGGGRIKKL
jgi:hypothetical protein